MGWQSLTSIKGPAGAQGPTGSEGPQGIPGPPGEDGAGIAIAGSVPTYADLPTGLTEADVGDGYLVDADGLLYVWNPISGGGYGFPADGQGVEFRGPVGPPGEQGPVGPKGDQGIQGLPGDTGAQGAPGERGATWHTGSGAPTTVANARQGDLYLDITNGDVHKLA